MAFYKNMEAGYVGLFLIFALFVAFLTWLPIALHQLYSPDAGDMASKIKNAFVKNTSVGFGLFMAFMIALMVINRKNGGYISVVLLMMPIIGLLFSSVVASKQKDNLQPTTYKLGVALAVTFGTLIFATVTMAVMTARRKR